MYLDSLSLVEFLVGSCDGCQHVATADEQPPLVTADIRSLSQELKSLHLSSVQPHLGYSCAL